MPSPMLKKISQSENVFVNEKGESYQSFRTSWGHILRRAKIEDLTFHLLRHKWGLTRIREKL